MRLTDVTLVVREALRIYREQAAAVLLPGVVLFLAVGLPIAVLGEVPAKSTGDVLLRVVAGFLDLLASYLYYGYVDDVAEEARRGGSVDMRQTLARAVPVVPALIAGSVLVSLGIVLGLLLLVLPGVWLATRMAVLLPVISIERPGPIRAIRRSSRLVKGSFGPVLVTVTLAVVLEGVIGDGLEDLGGELAPEELWNGYAQILCRQVAFAVANVFLAPLAGLIMATTYFRLREAERGETAGSH